MIGYRIAKFLLILVFIVNFGLEFFYGNIQMFDWHDFVWQISVLASLVYILKREYVND